MKRPALNIERAARADLRALPAEYRNSAVAKGYIELARRIDAGVGARDAAAMAREMRLCLLALYELAPPMQEDDKVDELRAKREARMKKLLEAKSAEGTAGTD